MPGRSLLTFAALALAAVGVHPIMSQIGAEPLTSTPAGPLVAAGGSSLLAYLDLIIRVVSVIAAWLLGRKQQPPER